MAPERRRFNRYETMQLDDIKRMPRNHAIFIGVSQRSFLKEGLERVNAFPSMDSTVYRAVQNSAANYLFDDEVSGT
jgi:hypothetical protein